MNSLLDPGRWLLYGAFAAALMLGIWRLDVSRQAIGYDRAMAELAAQVKVVDDKREAIAPPIAEKQEVAQVQIRTVTKTILKEVPVYVEATACPLPGGYRLLHDAAANGEVPDPAGLADAAAVPAAVATETTVSNYGACREVAARLVGLQSWVTAQQALNK